MSEGTHVLIALRTQAAKQHVACCCNSSQCSTMLMVASGDRVKHTFMGSTCRLLPSAAASSIYNARTQQLPVSLLLQSHVTCTCTCSMHTPLLISSILVLLQQYLDDLLHGVPAQKLCSMLNHGLLLYGTGSSSQDLQGPHASPICFGLPARGCEVLHQPYTTGTLGTA